MLDTSRRKTLGFTLIELLIVIAIIAILALIAIPNFLEAQVRARVSRVHADMRSIGTALESYNIDYNMHPLCSWDCKQLQGKGELPADPFPTGDKACLSKLTTPIAYLTSVFSDPFTELSFEKKAGKDPGSKDSYNYESLHSSPSVFGIETLAQNNKKMLTYLKGYRWMLGSFGPGRSNALPEDPTKSLDIYEILAPKQGLSVYDPTNGTVSFGFIIRTNKGVYTGQDYD